MARQGVQLGVRTTAPAHVRPGRKPRVQAPVLFGKLNTPITAPVDVQVKDGQLCLGGAPGTRAAPRCLLPARSAAELAQTLALFTKK